MNTNQRERTPTVPIESTRAFTRLDLLVLILTFCGLAILSRPVWGGSQTKSQAAVCLSNFKRLVTAWQIYAEDNRGRLVMVFHGGEALGGAAGFDPKKAPWAMGWQDWTTSRDNTNATLLTEDRFSKLSGYLQRSVEVFKCPGDQYLSSSQKARGWKERLRSVSANAGVGDGNAQAGPWDPTYKQVRTTSGFLFPGPAETFVYVEEHPDSMNDPAFFNPGSSSWSDFPGSFHGPGSTFAFADGHVEFHGWRASLASPAARSVNFSNLIAAQPSTGDADIHWVSYRGCRTSEKFY